MSEREYETRTMSWLVVPKGEPSFSEMATDVRIDDEAGGEYVVVDQTNCTALGVIKIDPQEWPAIRAAIDQAISQCRGEP